MAKEQAHSDDLLRSAQAAGLLKHKDAILEIMRSPDAQKLLQMLGQKGSDNLMAAAGAALKGNTAALTDLVGDVMRSKEGTSVVDQINRTIPQK